MMKASKLLAAAFLVVGTALMFSMTAFAADATLSMGKVYSFTATTGAVGEEVEYLSKGDEFAVAVEIEPTDGSFSMAMPTLKLFYDNTLIEGIAYNKAYGKPMGTLASDEFVNADIDCGNNGSRSTLTVVVDLEDFEQIATINEKEEIALFYFRAISDTSSTKDLFKKLEFESYADYEDETEESEYGVGSMESAAELNHTTNLSLTIPADVEDESDFAKVAYITGIKATFKDAEGSDVILNDENGNLYTNGIELKSYEKNGSNYVLDYSVVNTKNHPSKDVKITYSITGKASEESEEAATTLTFDSDSQLSGADNVYTVIF